MFRERDNKRITVSVTKVLLIWPDLWEILGFRISCQVCLSFRQHINCPAFIYTTPSKIGYIPNLTDIRGELGDQYIRAATWFGLIC